MTRSDGIDLPPGSRAALVVTAARNAYRSLALGLGRPTHPCACSGCSCELHVYIEGTPCAWCAFGDHRSVAL